MPKQPKQTCATCKWSRFPMTAHVPPRIKAGHVGECLWPIPECPQLPLAITTTRSWSGAWNSRRWMAPDETGCPCWEAK